MTEYRFARPEEEAEILDFINAVFSQAARPHDFEQLIPKVYAHPGFSQYHALAVEDGRIRGTVAMLPLTVHAGENTLRGGYIGSVSVHPWFRGKGYMKRLMEMQIEDAGRRGYDFMSLGGQRQRYQYFGFARSGFACSFSIVPANARHALPKETPFTFVPADESHLEQMAALHKRQAFFCERPRFLETLRTYGGVPYAIMNGPALSGYLRAFGNEITELCLASEHDLPAVAAAWLKERVSFEIRCGGEMTERIRGLAGFAEFYSVSPSAMLKILNWENTLRAVMNIRPLPDGERTVQIEGAGAYRLRAEHGKAEVVPCASQPDHSWTEVQAVEALFSPVNALLADDPVLRSWLPFTLEIPVADQF